MNGKALVIILSLLLVPALGCGKGDDAASGGEKSAASGGKKDKKDKKKKKKKGYEGGAVTGGGSISGTITYAGDKKDGTITITKDKEACAAKGETRPAGALIVADGKLSNAVVWIDGIKAGKAFEPGEVTIDNVGCDFVPRVVIAHVGGQIAARNSDAVLHNTHAYLKKGKKNLFNVALPQKDQVVKKKVKKAGFMDVKCDAHEWMQAWALASPHPYAAVTDAGGKFSFTDVPAGTYTVKVWHEILGEKEGSATVAAGGTATVDLAL